MKIDQFVRTGAMTYDEAITLEHLIRREQALRESGVTKPLPKEKRAEVSDGWQQHIRPLDAADREALRRCDEALGVDKPVAWRVRPSPTETCYFDGEEAAKEFAFREGTGARPLYIHPASKSTLTELQAAHAEIERLRAAIRRLAEQDATLSVQGGNVTVTMDATLTDEERAALLWFAHYGLPEHRAATLRGLLERLK
jgi:hypothetical protein